MSGSVQSGAVEGREQAGSPDDEPASVLAKSTFSKARFQAVQAQLHFHPSVAPNLLIVAFDAALLAFAVWALRRGGVGFYLLSQAALAVVFFNAFSLLHEAGHGSASRWRWFNTALGHVASVFCFVPYFPWKYIHQRHHVWTGNLENDPVLRSVRKFRDAGVPPLVRASWRSWVPMGALLQHVVYLTYPLVLWRSGRMQKRELWGSVFSVLFMVGAWTAGALLWPEVIRLRHVALALLFFFIAEELVNLPHHLDVSTHDGKLPLWEQHRATRSCYYPPGFSELLVLNFNFHTEHHLFPSLPWYRLRRARRLLKDELAADYQEAVGIRWNLRNRKQSLDTIIGKYRKAATPTAQEGPSSS